MGVGTDTRPDDHSTAIEVSPDLAKVVEQKLVDIPIVPIAPLGGVVAQADAFKSNLASVLVAFEKAKIGLNSSDPTALQKTIVDYSKALGDQILAYLQAQIIASSGAVTVVSVSGVTTGPGISGPGAGSATVTSTGVT